MHFPEGVDFLKFCEIHHVIHPLIRVQTTRFLLLRCNLSQALWKDMNPAGLRTVNLWISALKVQISEMHDFCGLAALFLIIPTTRVKNPRSAEKS